MKGNRGKDIAAASKVYTATAAQNILNVSAMQKAKQHTDTCGTKDLSGAVYNKAYYIFCDLDGTLLYSNKEPSRKTINYLRHLKEHFAVTIGIASGRAPSSILPLMKRFEMEDVIDIVIANNGVDTIDIHTGSHHREGLIQPETIAEIVNCFHTCPQIITAFHNPNILYATGSSGRVDSIMKMNDLHLIFDPVKDTSYQGAPRVMLLFDPVYRTMVEEAVKQHPIQGVKGYFAEPDIYEFSSCHISKHKAIEAYVQQFKHTLRDVMVFGDSENDIGMLKGCGIGVAMRNAEQTIQDCADWVSEYTNDEDGIYEFLCRHEYLLREKEN